MPQKLTRNHKQIAGKMSSQNVLKARDYRGEEHCDKKKVSRRRLQECNKNSNHFQHVERGDDDEEGAYANSSSKTSKPANVLRSELGFNNNAEAPKSSRETSENTEGLEASHIEELESEFEEAAKNMKVIINKLNKAKKVYTNLEDKQKAVANEAIQKSMELQKKTGNREPSAFRRFGARVRSFFDKRKVIQRRHSDVPEMSPRYSQIKEPKTPKTPTSKEKKRKAYEQRVREFKTWPDKINLENYVVKHHTLRPKQDNILRMSKKGSDSVFED